MEIVMFIFGVLTVISAAGVVFSRRSLNSALSLVVTLFLVAIHFALLGADFLAALQIIIYAGAIMILVVFVIMLLGLDKPSDKASFQVPAFLGATFCGVFLGVFLFVSSGDVVFPLAEVTEATRGEGFGSAHDVGKALLTRHVFAFQITGLLLLAAIVGAVVLATDKPRPLLAGRGLKAIQEREGVEGMPRAGDGAETADSQNDASSEAV